MRTDIELSRKQLLEKVSAETRYRDVNPKSFYRWLQALGFTQPPYGVLHLQAVTHYADRLALGMTAKQAHESTDQYIQEITNHGNTEGFAITEATATAASTESESAQAKHAPSIEGLGTARDR